MAHILLIGITEPKSPDNKIWKFPYALPIIVQSLQETEHSFETLDTHLDKLEFHELCDVVISEKRQVYGISAWSHNYLRLKELTACIRSSHPDAIIVVGGIISGNADVVLETTDTDIVCVGAEGEHILPDILDSVDNGLACICDVAGICYRDSQTDSIVRTAERPLMTKLEYQQQPMPAYGYYDKEIRELVANIESKDNVPIKAFPLLTARGCPFHCTFCGHLYGRKLLRKNWDLFFDQVEILVKKYGATGFFNFDTNMFLNEKDVEEYCRLYDERGMDFEVYAELRLTFGDYAMFRKLRQHGVKIANFGLESGSQEMLDRMKKGTKLDVSIRIIKDAMDAGMILAGNFCFGTPGESRKTIGETRRFMLQLRRWIHEQKKDFARRGEINTSRYGWSILLLTPTSELYQQAKSRGLIPDEATYLESISDERFTTLAAGSNQKISLCQEAGEVNMSRFSSRRALAEYVKFTLCWVDFRTQLFDPYRAVMDEPKVTAGHFIKAVRHFSAYLLQSFSDRMDGRQEYVPVDEYDR